MMPKAKSRIEFWDKPGAATALTPLLGKEITAFYLLPGERCILVLFDRTTLMMSVVPNAITADLALKIEIGELKPDFTGFSEEVERFRLKALEGLTFTGMEGNVLTFEDKGVMFHRDGRLQFVRQAGNDRESDAV